MNRDEIMKKTSEIHDWMIELRNDFHMYPEIGRKEFRTQQKICRYLGEMGIRHEKIADTGVLGIIEGKAEGKVVALRADIDALPMHEESDAPYKSRNDGMMHACGHDAHTAIQLGTAKVLEAMKDRFNGKVKLLFQPDEEGDGGAERMVALGCMENPTVDYVLGLHVMGRLECGEVEMKKGKFNAASDGIKILVRGKSAHGAYPSDGVDAIVISAHVIQSLQTLVSRNVSPLNSVVLSFGTISGGEAENVIAENVTFQGTLRTLDEETREFCKKRIIEIATKTAEALGGRADVTIKPSYKALINDDDMVDLIAETAQELFGEENLIYREFPSLGVEDFSYFLDKAKGAFYHIGCADPERGITASNHNSRFDVAPRTLLNGARLQLVNTFKLLEGER